MTLRRVALDPTSPFFMRIYSLTQRLPWPASYAGRILFICFLGTHVPLVALTVWALLASRVEVPVGVFLVVLFATLLGTAATLSALTSMLRPVKLSAAAMNAYGRDRTHPKLPTHYEDEAGQLMARIQETLIELDDRLGEISRIAMTDTLTGAYNRRWLDEVAVPAFEKSQREGRRPSVLVIDLDEFKSVNDRWGHSIGDDVLTAVCDGLRASVRDGDRVVRVGGDEFCIVLPTASEADATALDALTRRVDHDLKAALSALPHEHRVTASIGGATSGPNDRSFMDVYRRADRNLYAVKRSGRNAFRIDDLDGT